MRAIANRAQGVELDEVRRQKGDELQIANSLRFGDAEKALQILEAKERIHIAETASDARREAANAYISDKERGKTSLVIASTRREVNAINQDIRAALKERGYLNKLSHVSVSTAYGRREFSENDRVIFKKKYVFGDKDNKNTTVWNGATGVVKSAHQIGGDESTRAIIYIQLDHSNEVVKLDTEHIKNFDHGYASTVHVSQGATVDITRFVSTSDFNSREISYVAGSRHTQEFHIYTTRERWENGDIHRQIERSSAKDNALDYIRSIEHLPAYEEREKNIGTDRADRGHDHDRADRGHGADRGADRGHDHDRADRGHGADRGKSISGRDIELQR